MMHRSYAALLFVLVIGMTTVACHRDQSPAAVLPAAYHWKTVFAPDSAEQAWLQANDMDRLYLKFFDVDIDGPDAQPEPHATIVLSSRLLPNTSYVPCVFITNRVFSRIGEPAIDRLARQVSDKILRIVEQSALPELPDEVQIDCDWTATTRAAYFRFLSQLKGHLSAQNIRLSVTIRLHQAKFPEQTGVPPADRGMLMFYNIGSLSAVEENNSILNLEDAQKYLSDYAAYPLPLDLALPIFHWGVLFREETLIRLINNLEATALSDTAFFRTIAPHRFEVKKSTYLNGTYLYAGDHLRIEQVQPEALMDIATLIKPRLARDSFYLALYHLDPETIKFFPHDSIQALLRVFD